jgi:beta-glucosidase
MKEGYRDASRPLEERVEDLLERMSLDEKLAQLGCVWSTYLIEDDAFSEARAGRLLGDGIGHVTRVGGATGLRPREIAAFTNTIQRFLADRTRLGIPAIVHEESCAGLTARDATQFPQAIGLACTWNPALAEAMGEVIRAQMLAVGARQTLAPVLDVARDVRWGRTEETFGEDPYLVGRMGVGYVRGIQGEDLSRGVAATAKHFLGYGASEGGLNHAPAHIGPRELREVFARPFEAVIREAGIASVMNAYSEVDGLACGGSKAILDDLLRGELGFEGAVVADYYTIGLLASFHAIAADAGEAAQLALEAGIDVELPQLDCYGAPLRTRVESGAVPTSLVDRAVRRVLRLKFALGLFDRRVVDERAAASVYETPEQRTLARRIAQESIVLLKNERALLPLDPGIARLAVVGPSADDPRLLQGDYSYPAHLEILGETFRGGSYRVPMVTPLAGIRAAVSPDCRVQAARGSEVTGDSRAGFAEALEAARTSDVAIVCVGGKSGLLPDCTSGEFRDRADLGLPGVQQALVEAVVATGTPTVVVLIDGRPLALPWVAAHVPAVLVAWLPGEEGGNALADVLFGRSNPAGRLPITMPRAVGQVPVYYNHKSGGGRSQMLGDYVDLAVRPLFPFGHGLSYTRFDYGPLEVSPAVCSPVEPVRIALDITNAGSRDGDEVVQLYVRDVVARVTRPVKQLAGFTRIHLRAGESRRVCFALDPRQLAFYDHDLRLVVEAGEIRIMVGASSEDIRREGSFRIDGMLHDLRLADVAPTGVRIEPVPGRG